MQNTHPLLHHVPKAPFHTQPNEAHAPDEPSPQLEFALDWG